MREDKDIQSIKYRLIGALVIIASFTLAWLLLLDHDVKRQSQWDKKVPKPIEIERFEVAEAKLPTAAVVEETVETLVEEKTTATVPAVAQDQKPSAGPVEVAKKAPEKKAPKPYTQLNDKGLPDAWVLQVASFKEKSNAKKLQQTLLKHEFIAYIKAFNLSSGRIYRVIIGPKMDKSRAQKLAQSVEKKVGMKTLLVAYKPGFEE
ncbi:SPOR domain-containing protein [uncultured Paraglaciecola sp.]|uniref:SPOR domain-containing protein n=1 Tax=uncultured Paraglaciecola sp. TaxID=1765024 RepID=UPI0026342AE8|nr:SPOR domain-containing protein [uncultured Paraglaciecola sp.]